MLFFMELQIAFLRSFARREAEIIPFPKRFRRRSGNRQVARDAVNSALDRS